MYQGRFKSFPVQEDDHFYTVNRYVERNALRADLVERAESWQWGNLWRWKFGSSAARKRLWTLRLDTPQCGRQCAYTWRGIREREPFWPGQLDLVTYDHVKLKPSKGQVVDTSRLPGNVLDDLGLQADDSLASDHLLLIADFEVVR